VAISSFPGNGLGKGSLSSLPKPNQLGEGEKRENFLRGLWRTHWGFRS